MFPKPTRLRDEKYLDWIRAQPCAVCLKYGAEPHHMQTRGAGGSDHLVVPLCRLHHTMIHTIGLAELEDRLGINLWRVVGECLSGYVRCTETR